MCLLLGKRKWLKDYRICFLELTKVSLKLGGLKKKKELNSLIVVEIRSPKSRCQQDEFLLEDL